MVGMVEICMRTGSGCKLADGIVKYTVIPSWQNGIE